MEEIFNKIIEQLQYEREYSHADFPDYVENVSSEMRILHEYIFIL